MFCFFKQKTAYEMRISDWSSDVCSSDLMYNQLCLAGRWPVGPHRIDGVAVDGDQLCALLRQSLGSLVDPSFRVQPGIIADPGTAGGMLAQPFGHAADRKSTRLNSSH